MQADEVVIAANGYTRDIRRVVPLGSHIIATEELPPNLAVSLIPKRRTFGRYRPRAVLLLDVPGRYANDLGGPHGSPRNTAAERANPRPFYDRSSAVAHRKH